MISLLFNKIGPICRYIKIIIVIMVILPVTPTTAGNFTEYRRNARVNSKCQLPVRLKNSDDFDQSWYTEILKLLEDLSSSNSSKVDGCTSAISIQKFSLNSPIVCGRRPKFILGATYCDPIECDTMTVFSTDLPDKQLVLDVVKLMNDPNYTPIKLRQRCS